MEISRDVWKSSPNVLAHLEMEAKKHQLARWWATQEESPRTEGQFVSHKFELFSLKVDSDKDSTCMHFLSATISYQMEQYNIFNGIGWVFSIWKSSSGKDCSTSFPTRTTVYFIKRHGCSDCPNIPVKARKAEHLSRFSFCPKNFLWKILFNLLFPPEKPFTIHMTSARRQSPGKIYSWCHALLYLKPKRRWEIL